MSTLSRRAWAEDNKLRGQHPNINSSGKFILDNSPFGEDEDATPTDYTFIGRILPTVEPFAQTALTVKIHLPNAYPAVPPEVRILTRTYHPNVSEDGQVCLPIVQLTEAWKPSLYLSDVVRDLVNLIDQPDVSRPMNEVIANEYIHKKDEYDRQAAITVQRHLVPRS